MNNFRNLHNLSYFIHEAFTNILYTVVIKYIFGGVL